jgi:hypothetical protein
LKLRIGVSPGVSTHSGGWDIAEQIIRAQRRAVSERSFALWIQTTHFENDLTKQLQELWFVGYVCRIPPQRASIQLTDVKICNGNIIAESRLRFEYADYDPVEENRTYTISFVSAVREWRIVKFTNDPLPFPREVVERRIALRSGPIRVPEAQPWWRQKECASLASSSSDPLSAQIYARAITRTVRFREAHPEIECAAILTDLMSVQVSQLAVQLANSDLLQLLANLYHASQQMVVFSIERPDRDNTWFSKLQAPWFSYDEMAAQREGEGPIVGSCTSVMSFYFALLRLGSYGLCDVFQLRLHNQDVLLVRIEPDAFLLCSDRVIDLTPRVLYYATQIAKVFTDVWYWTSLGATNMAKDVRRDLQCLLKKKLPASDFDYPVVDKNAYPEPLQGALFPNFNASSDPIKLSRLVKRRVLQLSNKYPCSPFTWAKYAYQTLFVAKPETYAAWSLQSPVVFETIRQYPTLHELLRVARGFGTRAIFHESDRLMTADQVIRYKTGDLQSRALLLFTLFKQQENEAGFVLFTDQGAYCVWPDGKKWKTWSASTFETVSSPEGSLLIAFDDRHSIYPLVKENTGHGEVPSWYPALVNL